MSACAVNMVEEIAETEKRALVAMEFHVAVSTDNEKPPGDLSIHDAIRVQFEMWGVSNDDAQFLVKTRKQRRPVYGSVAVATADTTVNLTLNTALRAR